MAHDSDPPDLPAATTLRELCERTGCDLDALIEFCFAEVELWELPPDAGPDPDAKPPPRLRLAFAAN